MKNRWIHIAALFAAALSLPASSEASCPNLIVNGSFEEPALSYGSWNVFSSIPGWQTLAGPGIEIQNHAAGSPLDGDQLVELDSFGPTSMFQEVSTVPGKVYTLRYAYSPRPGVSSNEINVLVDGVVVDVLAADGSGNPDTVWTGHTYTFAATGSTTRIQFDDASWADSLGGYLDLVSLVADPDINVLFNQLKPHKSGSTVPVKVQVVCGTENLSSPSLPVMAVAVYLDGDPTPIPAQDAGKANPGGFFRYSLNLEGYIFNLQTKGMAPGNYTLKFKVGNYLTEYSVRFVVR